MAFFEMVSSGGTSLADITSTMLSNSDITAGNHTITVENGKEYLFVYYTSDVSRTVTFTSGYSAKKQIEGISGTSDGILIQYVKTNSTSLAYTIAAGRLITMCMLT